VAGYDEGPPDVATLGADADADVAPNKSDLLAEHAALDGTATPDDLAQVAVGLLRQQLPSTVRVHGVMTNGGEAPNAIPARTEGRWYVRAESLDQLAEIEPRVRRCFEAGALATGCDLQIEPESKPYAEFRADERALAAYRSNALALGRTFADAGAAARMNRASTDMGNVSQVVPAIHPYIGIGSLPAINHQREFGAQCVGDLADRALLDGAIALAWTAVDRAAADPIAEER